MKEVTIKTLLTEASTYMKHNYSNCVSHPWTGSFSSLSYPPRYFILWGISVKAVGADFGLIVFYTASLQPFSYILKSNIHR